MKDLFFVIPIERKTDTHINTVIKWDGPKWVIAGYTKSESKFKNLFRKLTIQFSCFEIILGLLPRILNVLKTLKRLLSFEETYVRTKNAAYIIILI